MNDDCMMMHVVVVKDTHDVYVSCCVYYVPVTMVF